jgi:putative CocE/NonD family hydrolase
VKDRFNVRVPLRDGVTVSADVYLPEGDGPFPAIVTRTPYNKNTAEAYKKGRAMAERGYAFVWMDVRGRGDSDGVFTPFRLEAPDGYDCIEWAAEQPWCDGDVVSWGWSYSAYTQWMTALLKPPHLRAMITYGSPQDPYPFGEWGVGTHPPVMITWMRFVDGRMVQHIEPHDWPAIYRTTPIVDMDEAAGFHSPHWRSDHAHPTRDEYWEPLSYSDRMGELDVPVLHVTGWYDDGAGTYRNFARMSREAASERARAGQRLIVGPWIHEVNKDRTIGELDFGPDALVDLDAIEQAWMDRWVRGIEDADDSAPVRLFVMGPNEWRDEAEWPLERTDYTPLYLGGGGNANSRFGDGTLSFDAPAEAGEDTFVSDPERPVPYIYDPEWFQLGGPDDYAGIEQRGDVLVYTSEPLTEPLELTGQVRALLHASTDARDTDFMVKLLDVHPNGFAQRLCDGAVRGRYRDGLDREELLEPGEVYELEVDCWFIGHEVPAGHRIRIEVAGSAFPKYTRNPNTGNPLATDTDSFVARSRVHHGGERLSHVLLPVIRRSAV